MSQYDAASIEVLSGLDPVRKRPGMYTDTSRPNHLAQEVITTAECADPAGGSGHDDVAVLQREVASDRLDQKGRLEDHLRVAALLHPLTVDIQLQAQ